MSKRAGLKKGILIVLMVNIINLIFKLLTNFLMPKFLTVDCYADFKYYQLFIGYLGIMHFGFVDGVYIKFGGKSIDEISNDKLGKSFAALLILEIAVSIVTLIVSLIIGDKILFTVTFAILPTEVAWFYKYIYQATGEFSKYGRIMNINTILVFVFEITLIVLNIQNVYYYIAANTVSLFIIWIILERNGKFKYQRSWFAIRSVMIECKDNISSGIFVMLGNFASQFLTSMDRWFIKIFMDSVAFAQYSFAASIVVFMNVAVTPFSVTFYNHFCNHRDKKTVSSIQGAIYIFSSIIIALAFPAKWILEHYIQNYIDASDVLVYLFAAQAFSIIISCIYVNLYKAMKRQRVYSIKMAIMVGLGFVTNVGFYMITHTKEAFAVATLVTTFIWYILCQLDFKEYVMPAKSQTFIIAEVIAFLLTGNLLPSVIGFLFYIIITFIMTAILMRSEFKECLQLLNIGKIVDRLKS